MPQRPARLCVGLLVVFACSGDESAPDSSPTRLTFSVQPTSAQEGTPIRPSVQVVAQDNAGNRAVGFGGTVELSLTGGTPGAGLGTSTTVSAVQGVATFANLAIDSAGSGYTLIATATGLASATSSAFNVALLPKLVFTTTPANFRPDQPLAPRVEVTLQDAQGATVTSFNGLVTVEATSIEASLIGVRAVNAVAGIAAFTGVTLVGDGPGYTLTARAAGARTGTSPLIAGTPRLVFEIPSTAYTGGLITPAIEISVRDASGALLTTFNETITLRVVPNDRRISLEGATQVTAVAGLATFSDLRVGVGGIPQVFEASAATLPIRQKVLSISCARSCWEHHTSVPFVYGGRGTVGSRLIFISGLAPGNPTDVFDLGTKLWSRRATLPQPRNLISVVAVGSRLYALGGLNLATDETLSNIDVYDPMIDAWTARSPMPAPREDFASAAANDLIFVIGGAGAPTLMEAYDPATEAWTPRAPLLSLRHHGAAVSAAGRIYLAGGFNSLGRNPTVDMYDPAGDSWTTVGTLPSNASVLGGMALANKVYWLLSRPEQADRNFVTLAGFDVTTNGWSNDEIPLPASPTVVGYSVVGSGPGGLFVLGGDFASIYEYRP